jgi:hypothetical protein
MPWPDLRLSADDVSAVESKGEDAEKSARPNHALQQPLTGIKSRNVKSERRPKRGA